ncbi:acetate--CoA ligase family protein [Fodinisporobacter ferrooxydans]|uniref:Acetate--CoA ligase family protein n=1 Tax=Fodinisporobacter ferrooxydans TaxID=2901836 RepID=A0ABY4CPJ3_9BACL|nr:acetate--CoA ligase family protein [Alicyclobacillaceae bacterium MYW30-H2]
MNVVREWAELMEQCKIGDAPVAMTEYQGTKQLADLGFPVVEGYLATTEDEAVQYSRQIGYPVVMKIMSPQILHKSDVGGVVLGIQNDSDAKDTFGLLLRNARQYNSAAIIHGVLVQKMQPKGLELIVGVNRDPVFGHMAFVGAGGTTVELLKDFSMRLLPINEVEAGSMLQQMKIYPLLSGYRGANPLDEASVIQLLMKLNTLCSELPQIKEVDLNPVFVYEHGIAISDVRILLEKSRQNTPANRIKQRYLDKMFNPKSIAVIGASSNVKKNGGRLFHYIVKHGYKGKLYPVNPGAEEILGYPCFPSLEAIPETIDLACIIVRAEQTPEVLESCIRKGIKAAIIYSSGFAEIGWEGQLLQQKITEIADRGGISLCGPNSIGIASPILNTYTAFGMALQTDHPISGPIGFVSQSGAMGSALLSRAWEQGVGFSRWISVGNEADMAIPDFIKFLVDDPETKVITAFIEGIKDGSAFIDAAEAARQARKPLVLYKTGISEVGQRAVQSHTGALAGNDQAYQCVFAKVGAIRVENVSELIDVSRGFMMPVLPKGNRIGVVTASGGACSVIADGCSAIGLNVPQLSTGTQQVIAECIPPFGAVQNPVDVTAELLSKPDMFKRVLQAVVADPNVDALLIMLTTSADPVASVVARAIVEVRDQADKPILVGRLGADFLAPQALQYFREHQVPVFPTPDRVVKVMKYLVEFGMHQYGKEEILINLINK